MRDEFFADLFGELKEQSYRDHPPDRVLRRYVRRRLLDGERFSEEVERLLAEGKGGRWTLTTVSFHVATCRRCAARVAQLRAGVSPWQARRKNPTTLLPRWTLRRGLTYIPLASAAIGLVLLLLHIFLFNAPPPHANYLFGAEAM